MTWTIDLSDVALKALTKMDKTPRLEIREFIDKELPKMTNPRSKGKALSGDLKGLWRYRVGNYRVICQIKDNELVICVLRLDTERRFTSNKKPPISDLKDSFVRI